KRAARLGRPDAPLTPPRTSKWSLSRAELGVRIHLPLSHYQTFYAFHGAKTRVSQNVANLSPAAGARAASPGCRKLAQPGDNRGVEDVAGDRSIELGAADLRPLEGEDPRWVEVPIRGDGNRLHATIAHPPLGPVPRHLVHAIGIDAALLP